MSTKQWQPHDRSLKLEPLDAELQIFHCSYPNCGYKNKRKDDVAHHERSHDPSFKWDFDCGICHKIFGSLVSFLHHMSSQHGDKLLCPLCKFEAENLTDFKQHILTHTFTFNSVPKINRTEFRCGICSQYFTTKAAVALHLKNDSCKSKLLTSVRKAQGQNLDTSQESTDHCEEHPRPVDEEMDKQQPKEPDGLKLEALDENNEEIQMFSCSYPNCSFKDKQKDHVARHEKRHDPSSKWDFFCQVCPESFESVVSFLHHMATGHGDKLFCPLCQFQGRDWAEFKPHVLTHTLTSNSVPTLSKNISDNVATVLRCAICSIIFTNKEALSQHLKKCCRKLKPFKRSWAKKKKVRADNDSQESSEHSEQTEKSGCYQREEISNGGSGSSLVPEEPNVESILGL